jgi:hypothetical protein
MAATSANPCGSNVPARDPPATNLPRSTVDSRGGRINSNEDSRGGRGTTGGGMINNANGGVATSDFSLLTQDPYHPEHAFDYGNMEEEELLPSDEDAALMPSSSRQDDRSRHHNQIRTTTTTRRDFGGEEEDEFETALDDDELAALDVDNIVNKKPIDDRPPWNNYNSGNHHRGGVRAPLRTIYNQGRDGGDHDDGFSYGDNCGLGGGYRAPRNSYPPEHHRGGGNGDDDRYMDRRKSAGYGIGSTFGDSYDSTFGGNNGGGAFPRNHNDYDLDVDGFANNVGSSSGNVEGVPLCPGHSRPCRTLTAGTANNAGRQFYKCSMPEGEQCDFFEWADGGNGGGGEFGGGGSMYDSVPVDGGGGGGIRVAVGDETKDFYSEVRRVFGHPGFRPGQREVIEHAMSGRDVFVLMPTGGGKSLCYQLPAWCEPGLSVVISPLLSLIEDQVQSMTKLGVESVFLNSTQSWEGEQQLIVNNLINVPAHGGVKLLYITPEKLSHSSMIKGIFKKLSERRLISRFVVDEAHCLSDWYVVLSPRVHNTFVSLLS